VAATDLSPEFYKIKERAQNGYSTCVCFQIAQGAMNSVVHSIDDSLIDIFQIPLPFAGTGVCLQVLGVFLQQSRVDVFKLP